MPEIKALAEWLAMGGRLVLCVGPAGRPGSPAGRSAGRASPPAASRRWSRLRQTGAIEVVQRQLPAVDRWPIPRVVCACRCWPTSSGVVEIREADLPLVIRQARGFGQLVFLALDPDQPPLANWPTAAG